MGAVGALADELAAMEVAASESEPNRAPVVNTEAGTTPGSPARTAHRYVLDGLDPGEYRFSLRIAYQEGTSDEWVTMQQNVSTNCNLVLTAAAHTDAGGALGGSWRNWVGNGTGCTSGGVWLQWKKAINHYWESSFSLPNTHLQKRFILGNLEPGISYDLRVVAGDARCVGVVMPFS